MHNSCGKILDEELDTVAECLLCCESVLFQVGIPLTPDTKERIKLKAKYFSPLEDFIKATLVTVSTQKLREIQLLLDIKDPQNEDFLRLSKKLKPFSLFDIIYFPALVGIMICTLVLSIKVPYYGLNSMTLITALVSSLGGVLSSSLTITQKYRFDSFNTILKDELSRREGNNSQLPTRKLPLQTLNRNSLQSDMHSLRE